jgi:hypothetical protein
MESTTILALCGIAGILIILAALLLITVLRISIFGLANLVLKAVLNPKDEPSRLDNTVTAQSAGSRWRSRDLRQQAQSVDFDQAVARQRGEETPAIRPTSSLPSPNTTPTPSVNLPPDRSRRRRKDDEDDGLLGGFVDDGDGGDDLLGF